jgi:hypothetical protein
MRTVRGIIDRQAEKYSDKVFLFAPEPRRQLTYRDLRRDSKI